MCSFRLVSSRARSANLKGSGGGVFGAISQRGSNAEHCAPRAPPFCLVQRCVMGSVQGFSPLQGGSVEPMVALGKMYTMEQAKTNNCMLENPFAKNSRHTHFKANTKSKKVQPHETYPTYHPLPRTTLHDGCQPSVVPFSTAARCLSTTICPRIVDTTNANLSPRFLQTQHNMLFECAVPRMLDTIA